MKNRYSWRATTYVDANTGLDSTSSYDSGSSGHIFWEQFLGEPWLLPYTEWTRDEYYNYDDLNRVERDTEYIADMLAGLGQHVSLTTVTNRDRRRFEFFDSLNRIENNIKTLADNFYTPEGWEQPKTTWASLQRFDYRDANRLERNLLLLYELIQNVIENMKYCGTFTCGEEDLI